MQLDEAWARQFAEDWVEAWNSHDLEKILAHYTDDFEMHSPMIRDRGFSDEGFLQGKEAVRPYWTQGLAAQPPIRFELLAVYLGAESIAIHYRSVGRRLVVEVLHFDAEGRAVRGSACYGPPG